MSKAKKEVTKEVTNEVETVVTEKATTLKRKSTEQLLSSTEHTEKLAGVLRVLGDIESGREERMEDGVAKQTITNKISKATISIRTNDNEGEKMEKAKALTSKNWAIIKAMRTEVENKNLKLEDLTEVNKEVAELYTILLGFGKKTTVNTMPDEISF